MCPNGRLGIHFSNRSHRLGIRLWLRMSLQPRLLVSNMGLPSGRCTRYQTEIQRMELVRSQQPLYLCMQCFAHDTSFRTLLIIPICGYQIQFSSHPAGWPNSQFPEAIPPSGTRTISICETRQTQTWSLSKLPWKAPKYDILTIASDSKYLSIKQLSSKPIGDP